METQQGGLVAVMWSRAEQLRATPTQATLERPEASSLTLVMAAEAITTLDGDTVDARIPSLFRGLDVIITFCGWPEKTAVGMKRGGGKGLSL